MLVLEPSKMSGAWGTQAVERAPIEEIPLINEVHIDGLVSEMQTAWRSTRQGKEDRGGFWRGWPYAFIAAQHLAEGHLCFENLGAPWNGLV